MSNSLIPYSFTPGTKAKAQEVNANFIALAEKIEENKEYTTNQIADTLEKLEQSADETDALKADKNLGNTPLITNCVLEAPNGVVTASGDTITVKAGLKVLIPNGFNADGTLNNIEYEVEEDKTLKTATNTYQNCVYLTTEKCDYSVSYCCCEDTPVTKQGLWYVPTENKTYLWNSTSSAFEEIQAVPLSLFTNTDGTVSLVKTETPVRVYTHADKIGILNLMMPKLDGMVNKTWGTQYIAQRSGWVYIKASANSGATLAITVNGCTLPFNTSPAGVVTAGSFLMPVKRNDAYKTMGNCTSGYYYIFVQMEGDL